MALYKRSAIDSVLNAIRQGKAKQAYLCFGERFLGQQAASLIEQALIESGNGAAHVIDGSVEDTSKLLARLLSFSLLPGTQVYRVSDTRLFHSREVGADIWEKAVKAKQNDKPDACRRHLINLLGVAGKAGGDSITLADIAPDQWQKMFGFSHPGQDLNWADELLSGVDLSHLSTANDSMEKLLNAIEHGFPGRNVLLLTAENVDKRKKLFKHLTEYGEIIDCSVADGSSRAAVEEQKDVIRELANKTLAEFGKKIEPKVLEELFARIGFHPVAVVREVEKLALYAEERQAITSEDLDLLVGRTREDAIFELTEAFSRRKTGKALTILNHLLNDGIHGLAVIASMRNYLRRMLIFRSLQTLDGPTWNNRMNAGEFQKHYLPALKESGVWPDLLKGHPYALFMGFTQAAGFSIEQLKRSLVLLLEAEFKLKGAPVPPGIVLEELLVSLIKLNGPQQQRSL